IDSRADLARSINLMLADFDRHSLSEAQIAGFVGDGVWVLVRRALQASDPNSKAPDDAMAARALESMRRHYAEQMFVSTHLYPHVPETLARLNGRQVGLVTSKERDFARTLLDRLGIARYFDCIIGGDTLPERKPDPKPVLEALRQLGVPAGDAVMIGDSENDIYAGARAGTHTCGVTYGFRTAEELKVASPEVLVDGIDQVLEHFC
ncbi:MAG TPA: HAD-IA family hydrolase, partial [Blastocatellia bacterium]|nr:HAD-IA family hydrolase [Blastocatellia bacterium]